MSNLDTVFWWIGTVVALVGAAGVIAIVWIWALDRVLSAFGLTGVVLRSYASHLNRKIAARTKGVDADG